MDYPCKVTIEDEPMHWEGRLELIRKSGSIFEAKISGRGAYFHIITGTHISGSFLCIPNWNIGCELSSLQDIFWNREQLRRFLPPVDAETVVRGLSSLINLTDE